MKICILLSSYEGTGSKFEEYDTFQNPGIYVKTHNFEQRIVTKTNAKEKIDQIVREGFDYIWNFLWGPVDENIAGVNEIKYLESKNVPMLGTSSKFLSLTKLDYKQAIESTNMKTPKGIVIRGDDESVANLELGALKFPLIVKPSIGCGSEHMSHESVCHDAMKLVKQIKLLKSKVNVNYEIIIEEFIEGDETSVMVLETNNGVIALEPLAYVFPNDWPPTKQFLDFHLKFIGIERGEVTYKTFEGNPEMKLKIQETAVKVYQELGVLGSGYARVDFRLKGSEVYVLEINPCPAFFSELGNAFGDDFIIQTTFPGGHENLVDTIIAAKKRFDTTLWEYNNAASTYDCLLGKKGRNLIDVWENLSETFHYGGTILDIGCGTGMVGKVIKKKHDAHLTGIDMSPGMVKLVKGYEKVHIGLMENVVLELKTTFTHIVSSGALPFVDEKYFEKLFAQMFRLATNSISLTIDEISNEFKSACAANYNVSLFNHIDTTNNFSIPPEWSLVYKKRTFLWESPRIGTKIYGLVLRYEKSSCDK